MPPIISEEGIRRDTEQERARLQQEFQVREKGGEPEAVQELRKLIANVHHDMAQIEVRAATIVNMNPFPLRAQGPLLDDIEVPACPPGKSWSLYVIRAYKMDFPDMGGRYDARAVVPIVLAKDFVKQQTENFSRRGIFCYMGDHLPGKAEEGQMKKAFDEMVEYCSSKVRTANANWTRQGGVGKVEVGDPERKAFAVLKAYKLWTGKDPEWSTEIRMQEDVMPPCLNCGAEPNKGAIECKACGWVVNPSAAWERGLIDLANERHLAALRQLSREELDAMGLKHLPTAAQYRKEQLAAFSKPAKEAKA